jgi:DNA invertase Pin-like site-specific DNA recombinase
MEIGYARVSTREQDLGGQVAELTAARCTKVFREKASGARRDRVELAKVLRRLEPGDVLVVTRLDRLARADGIDFRDTAQWLLKQEIAHAVEHGERHRPEKNGHDRAISG